MTLHNRFMEKGINAALITLLLMGAGIYSCFAQDSATPETTSTVDPKQSFESPASANEGINLASNLNFSAVASPLTSVNSSFAELKPAVSMHGTRLYFSRAFHPDNTAGAKDKEDIWYVDIDKETSQLSEPKRLEGTFNNDGPNFIMSSSISGDTLFLGNQYSKKGKMRAGFSYSVRQGTGWSTPRAIKVKNEYNFSDKGNAYISFESSVMISAVEREDSKGETDLYVSFIVNGEATEPVNMGHILNSERAESSPYLSKDQETIYFASKGHNGYGGYDIYMSRRLDDTWTNWSKPENLGPVVNSERDEEFFSMTHCEKFAYFSKQVGNQNTDIYKVTISELFGANKAIFR